MLYQDPNLRSSVRALLYYFGQSHETSPGEFASSISDWQKNLALIQQYHGSSEIVFSDALVDLYPGLMTQLEAEMANFQEQPTITILTPLFTASDQVIESTLRSVEQQFYKKRRLCLLTERSTGAVVRESARRVFGESMLVDVREGDDLCRNLAPMLNEALNECEDKFVGFLSAGDRLTRTALFEVVRFINRQPEADTIYSDEEQNAGEGLARRFFKPGWSPDLFCSLNYLQNFLCCRTEAVRSVGGFHGRMESDIKYGLLLRMVEHTRRIHHLPQVLYHEQLPKPVLPGCPANLSFKFHKQSLSDYLKRVNIEAEVSDGLFPGSFRVRRKIRNEPKVSIIIPTRDSVDLLRQCLESIETLSSYRNYEIIVVDNGSTDTETLNYLNHLDHRVLQYPDAFNFSAINNMAARVATGEHLLFLNDDTCVINADWIEAMLEHSQRAEVGAVGAKLLYPDGSVQHGGVAFGPDGRALHLNRYAAPSTHGYTGLASVIRNLNAVTGACLMTRAELFQEVGGFEEKLPVHYNDIDLCLKMRARGLLVVYTPFAQLVHFEGVRTTLPELVEIDLSDSGRKRQVRLRVPEGHRHEVERFYSRWQQFIIHDDYYAAPEL